MKISRKTVEIKLLDYLNQRSSLVDLVDWAEDAMMDGEFAPNDADLLTPIIAKLGLADVKEFGLTWEDCSDYLSRLGYRVQVVALAL